MARNAVLLLFLFTIIKLGSPQTIKKLVQIHFNIPNLIQYPKDEELDIHIEYYDRCGTDDYTEETISLKKGSDSVLKIIKIMEINEKSCIHIGFHLYHYDGRYVEDILIYPFSVDQDQLFPIVILENRFIIMRTMIQTAGETMCELQYSVKFDLNEIKKCFGGKNTIYAFDYRFNPTNFSIDGLKYIDTKLSYPELFRLFPLFFFDYLSKRFGHIKYLPPVNDIVSLFGYSNNFKFNRYSYSSHDRYHPSTVYLHKTLNYLQFKMVDCSKQLQEVDYDFCEVEKIKKSYYLDKIIRVSEVCENGNYAIVKQGKKIKCYCEWFGYGEFCERSDSLLNIKVNNIKNTQCLNLINIENYKTWLNFSTQQIFLKLPLHELQSNILLSFYLNDRINQNEKNKPDILHSKALADIKNCSLNRGKLKCHFKVDAIIVVMHLPMERIIFLIILGILLIWFVLTNKLPSDDSANWESEDQKTGVFRDYSLPAPEEKIKPKDQENVQTPHSRPPRKSEIAQGSHKSLNQNEEKSEVVQASETMESPQDKINTELSSVHEETDIKSGESAQDEEADLKSGESTQVDEADIKSGESTQESSDQDQPKTKLYRITSFDRARDGNMAELVPNEDDLADEDKSRKRPYAIANNKNRITSYEPKMELPKRGNIIPQSPPEEPISPDRTRDRRAADSLDNEVVPEDENQSLPKGSDGSEVSSQSASTSSTKRATQTSEISSPGTDQASDASVERSMDEDLSLSGDSETTKKQKSKLAKSYAIDDNMEGDKSSLGYSKSESIANEDQDYSDSNDDKRAEREKLKSSLNMGPGTLAERTDLDEPKSVYEKFTDLDSTDRSHWRDSDTSISGISNGIYIINPSKSLLPSISLESNPPDPTEGLPRNGIYQLVKQDTLTRAKKSSKEMISATEKLHPKIHGISKVHEQGFKSSAVILTPIGSNMNLDEIVKSNKSLYSDPSASVSFDQPMKSRVYIVTPLKREAEESFDAELSDSSESEEDGKQRKYIITNFEPEDDVSSQIELDKQAILSKYQDIVEPSQRPTTLIITELLPEMESYFARSKSIETRQSSTDISVSDQAASRTPGSYDHRGSKSSGDRSLATRSFTSQLQRSPESGDTSHLAKMMETSPDTRRESGEIYSAVSYDRNKETDDYDIRAQANDYIMANREESYIETEKEGMYIVNKLSSPESASLSGSDDTKAKQAVSGESLEDQLSPGSSGSVTGESIERSANSSNIPGVKEASGSSLDQVSNESDLESGSVIDHEFDSDSDYPGKNRGGQ